MKKTIISVMLLVGLIISPTSAFTAQILKADAFITPKVGNLLGGLGCFVGGELPGQYDWTIGNCVPGGTPTDDMVFSTKDTTGWQERMRITKEGKVGIGTVNPIRELDVNGGIDVVEGIKAHKSYGSDRYVNMFWHGADYGEIHAWDKNASAYVRMQLYGDPVILGGGNVGIGTMVPRYKLDVEGDVQAYAYHTGDIFFQKDGEELWRMFEDEDGLYLESLKTGKVYRFLLQEVKK